MKKKILGIFLGFLALFIALGVWLKIGVFINNIQISGINLEQLYIKLDKKFIVKAKNITINFKNEQKSDEKQRIVPKFATTKELVKIAKNLDYMYFFVQEMDIESFKIADNEARILFKDNEFFIDSYFIFLNLIATPKDRVLEVDIKTLFLKDYELSVSGHLSINSRFKTYVFNGEAMSKMASFKSQISFKKGIFAYKFEDIKLSSLNELMSALNANFSLNEELFEWLGNKFETRAEFEYLQGMLNIRKDKFQINDLAAKGVLSDSSLMLDKQSLPIKFQNINLNLKEQNLSLDFINATYNNAKFNDSKIEFFDLFDIKKAGFLLDIKSDDIIFDEKLKNSLTQFGLNVPLYQTSGKTKFDLKLRIYFNEAMKSLYNGNFELENAKLSLLNLQTSKAKITLNQEKLNIENTKLSNENLNASFKASLNLDEKNGEMLISNLNYKNKFINYNDENVSARLDFKDESKAFVDKYKLNLNFEKGLKFELNDFNALASKSKMLRNLGLTSAKNITYESLNNDDFILKINEISLSKILRNKENLPWGNESFEIKQSKNETSINSKSKAIMASLSENKKQIWLNDFVYLHKSSDENESKFEPEILHKIKENIEINGRNLGVELLDFNKSLVFDDLKFELKNGNVKANASLSEAKFMLNFTPNDLRFEANNMSAEILDKFLHKDAFVEGSFDFFINGASFDFFTGAFNMKETYIKNLKGTNQLIAFIDTVPSLLIFKSPNFNQKGIHVANGRLLFERQKDKLSFSAIELKGDTSDLYGLGDINLRSKQIDIDLELKTLKSTSTIISKIPILNYVILGDSQEISTNIKVNGDLDNPKFNTQVLLDTLKTPFNLIKNILTLPKNLLN